MSEITKEQVVDYLSNLSVSAKTPQGCMEILLDLTNGGLDNLAFKEAVNLGWRATEIDVVHLGQYWVWTAQYYEELGDRFISSGLLALGEALKEIKKEMISRAREISGQVLKSYGTED